MKLREYRTEDAEKIVSWIRTEEELYRWSADIYGKFPLPASDMDDNYRNAMKSGKFIPLTAIDDNGSPVGHFIIRYPDPDNTESVRFGFIVVDPEIRGKGYGRQMILLGFEYVKENLGAKRIDLGVFDNNPRARRCYESVGFKPYGGHDVPTPFGSWHVSDLEIFTDVS